MLVCVAPAMAQEKELEVYGEWQSRKSTLQADRPFFMIRDIHDLERFWPQTGIDEPVPGIDFEKYMLLVWCPGSSLFDFKPVRVERFVYKDGAYLVLMEFERKDTGGYWRRPFMATMLPLVKSGDVFILRKIEKSPGSIDWQPMYAIWDMSGDRQRPFDIVSMNSTTPDRGFIDHGPVSRQTAVAQTTAEPAAAPVAPAAPTTEPVSAAVAVSQPATAAQTSPEGPTQAATPVAQPVQPVSQPAADSGKTVETPAPTTKPVQTAPTFEEDPLFGTEFDITF